MSNNVENTCEPAENVVTIGMHVIIKKHDYSKIYKVSENGVLMLGKDKVEMREIVGKPFYSSFEMVPLPGCKRTFSLKLALGTESWNDLKGELSGQDNRSITDDSTSQKLSKDEILQLQESGKTGKEILGSLIENSTSFAAKTEYSQEKYIRKKERKYCKILTVHKPTISSLHEVHYRQNHEKIGGLRMDALAQILSFSDVQADGLHLLYDSGSQGLPAAAMLNRIGENTSGYLINLHPGNMSQTAIVQAMNFPQELRDRHIAVNVYSFLRLHYQGESSILENICKKTSSVITKSDKEKTEGEKLVKESKNGEVSEISSETLKLESTEENCTLPENDIQEDNVLKRKLDEPEESGESPPIKKPKWFLETKHALDLLSESKARGLTIIAKEHPSNIAVALLPFLGLSRPFVIFHTYREALQQTYMELKEKYNVINVRLFTNFLRSYQVLPDRTHPDILMTDTGGYILTGYLVE
ncbi:tRNA (adenine(58)-N(1))-methyltransferase non-catalytic subunit TRM6 [Pseudomyrmex gracilis]|uniref:tRNA (adenine(58)-N(1))-methyltransferase non-catalytic subunit TRM6 n=1 Tax=Pseudomyrmex gracilis TaxID=219809 RepID=UPI00099566F9|nr:tRNA (adenine(58)-N(1))-methyltransferase non-catalytic subunit TRM6 [Pseudomyrmex gracilis]